MPQDGTACRRVPLTDSVSRLICSNIFSERFFGCGRLCFIVLHVVADVMLVLSGPFNDVVFVVCNAGAGSIVLTRHESWKVG